uniref:Venom peptide n=1 Tax=Heterorhabditis bacteriophora TaxID=37862 RepID=A0A1I7XSH4_HETBA
MRFLALCVIILLVIYSVITKPIQTKVAREKRAVSDKRQPKTRSSYIRFGKRADPNADLLYLDQLIL